MSIVANMLPRKQNTCRSHLGPRPRSANPSDLFHRIGATQIHGTALLGFVGALCKSSRFSNCVFDR
ncbi:hypothetical protein PILCRDRAFT_816114 [Piloderma croceum F 1598]|uniref:Uncharacterized protein n=1 Tax=Piloderma croceum (strain F 1598) TaxID=765440 RepID=A0A0C3C930_PILCF|nr:hypothetical protein PILCRDRAFT_816114 [Piloderma croceum F 1598]